MMRLGSIVITMAAKVGCHWTVYNPVKLSIPSGRICTTLLCKKTKANNNSFQIPMKLTIEMVAMAGVVIGTIMVKKERSKELPSMTAASSKERGIDFI